MTIFRVSKDIYIPVDMSLLYYKGKNLFPKQQITISKEQYNVLKNSMVTDCVRYRDLYRFYYGMFKNYYQRKWMKCLKRLRTIISGIIYEKSIRNKNNMEVKRKMTKDFQKMKIIREEILDLNNTILGRLNQLKNQFSTLHDLVGLIPINDMIRIISIKINDIDFFLIDFKKINNNIIVTVPVLFQEKYNKNPDIGSKLVNLNITKNIITGEITKKLWNSYERFNNDSTLAKNNEIMV